MSDTERASQALTLPDIKALGSLTYSGTGEVTYCTFPIKTLQDRVRAVNLINGKSQSIADFDTKTISILDVACTNTEWEDEEDGEVKECVIMKIELVDGTIIHSTGRTARKALGRIIATFPPPWPHGINVKIVSGLSNQKRRVYHLTLAPMVDDASV